MTDTDLSRLSTLVLGLTGLVTFVLGIVMRRSRFCTMGAIADIITMHDWTRLRLWAASLGVALIGTQTLAAAGLIALHDSLYTAPRLLPAAHLVGGGLFGLGMVLASGCPTRALLRAAGGSLKALIVLVLTGLFAFMTLRGVFGALRAASLDRLVIDLGVSQDLPSLLSALTPTRAPLVHLLAGLFTGGALLAWALRAPALRRPAMLGAATLIGGAIVAMWAISGVLGYVPEHPETLTPAYLSTYSSRMEALSYVAPLAHGLDLLLFWTDTRTVLTLGVMATLGLFAGALCDTLLTRSLHWEGFGGTEDTANHIIGAALMGVGAITALGCSIGQGLSGLSTLSLGSFLTLAGIVSGAVAGLRWQSWRAGV